MFCSDNITIVLSRRCARYCAIPHDQVGGEDAVSPGPMRAKVGNRSPPFLLIAGCSTLSQIGSLTPQTTVLPRRKYTRSRCLWMM